MKLRNITAAIITIVFLSILYSNLMAFKDGIVGFTKKNGEAIGCVCHGLEPNDSISVRISGPASVRVNDTATYVLSIANGPAISGGCDIATSLGDLTTSPIDTFLRRAEQFPGAGFELTHKEPKLFAGDTLKFYFRYIAPNTPNVTDTIFANGNSTNNDVSSDNDKWNYSQNFLVSVTLTDIEHQNEFVSDFTLAQNYPNPFNPATNITFTLARPTEVSLRIYDGIGRTVATLLSGDLYSAGRHEVLFDAGSYGLNSGVYFYELRAGGRNEVRKMLLVK